MDIPPEPLTSTTALLTVDEAMSELRIGRSLLYDLISSGDLQTITIGRRRLVPADAISAFVDARCETLTRSGA